MNHNPDTPSTDSDIPSAKIAPTPPLVTKLPASADQLAHDAMLERARSCLKRWATRYAIAPHAKAHVKETNLLVEQLGEYLLRR
jgi:hypothetical protein